MKPEKDTLPRSSQPLDWLATYSNNGDVGILDALESKRRNASTTGILDVFVPLDVMQVDVGGKIIERKSLIAGNYIFIQATREDILRLRQEPPFDATLRFLHPAASPTGCIYIPDHEVQMMRHTLERLRGEAEFFVPSRKELMVGDQVSIVGGRYEGIHGVLESVKGHEGGRIIVSLGSVLAVRTPKISPEEIQLLAFAKVSESQAGSYASRAYKKIHTLLEESERLLAEKEKEGILSETSAKKASKLTMRFSELRLSGKIRIMHAQAIYNLLNVLGETDSHRFRRFQGMLP